MKRIEPRADELTFRLSNMLDAVHYPDESSTVDAFQNLDDSQSGTTSFPMYRPSGPCILRLYVPVRSTEASSAEGSGGQCDAGYEGSSASATWDIAMKMKTRDMATQGDNTFFFMLLSIKNIPLLIFFNFFNFFVFLGI